MSIVHDIMQLEGGEIEDREDEAVRLQRIINDGNGWRMQGSVGRSMMAAIEAGDCMLGKRGTRDYWGNYIPARDEVKPGAMGSRAYVVTQNGEDWAEALEAGEDAGDAPREDTQ